MKTEALPDFDKLWDYDNPSKTEQQFRALLPKASAPSHAGYRAELLTQIARAQGLQRKFEEAHKTLDEVDGALVQSDSIPRIRYFLERGRVYNSSNNPDKSKPLFLEAWRMAKSMGADFYALDAAHMLGIIEPPKEALEWNEKALQLAETSEDPKARKWLGSLYNNIGWTYYGMGDFPKALDLFQKALDWRQKQGKQRPIRIAKWCVAKTLRSLGRTEEALAMQQELLKEWNAAGEHDGYVYEELAECLLALKRPDEAKPYFASAYEELSKDPWLTENEPDRINRLKEMSE
ncbi:tetratricopeptide repeat protein [Acidobacteriota bacterium]